MSIRNRVSACGLIGALALLAGAHTYAQAVAAQPVAAVSKASSPAAGQSLHGDAARGKVLYQNCTSCHSIDENDVGPKHRGVVGRKAGTVSDYAYSPALKASGIVWDTNTLDRWLTNPSALVPGTKMFFLLKEPQDRADIIAYLAELK